MKERECYSRKWICLLRNQLLDKTWHVSHGVWVKEERDFPPACSKVRTCLWRIVIYSRFTKTSYTKSRILMWILLLSLPWPFLWGTASHPTLHLAATQECPERSALIWQLLHGRHRAGFGECWRWLKGATHTHGAQSLEEETKGDTCHFTMEAECEQMKQPGIRLQEVVGTVASWGEQMWRWRFLCENVWFLNHFWWSKTFCGLNSACSLPVCTVRWKVGGQEVGGDGPEHSCPFPILLLGMVELGW